MIDIHCHIVPNVDDGPKNIDEAIEMAKIAQNEGIKTIINTSHYNTSYSDEKNKDLLFKILDFNQQLKNNNIDIEIATGNEIYLNNILIKTFSKDEIFTMNNSRYILVEFSYDESIYTICNILYELKLKGYKPIIAHTERYSEIQENPEKVEDIIKEGAFIQVNASSVLKKQIPLHHKITHKLLKNNHVHFIATDAHGPTVRRPLIKEAYDYVSKKYGKIFADNLFIENPSRVLNDEDIILENMPIANTSIFKSLFGNKK
ncbi:tyrosine-protein phosphatase [Romboutsia sp.]|uniref:tyrosine-protein phosphatase n=1 Tax=Romboutsia sp. TaxID=1965302 RepID=UPI003F3086F9